MVDPAAGAAVLLSSGRDARILVAGATGMLGAAAHARLRARFAHVDGTQRRDPSAPLYLRAGDAAALEGILRGGRYDYVINCVAVLADPALESDDARRRAAVETNALFPLALAEAAERHGARLLHVSTDGVFSGRSDEPYDETSPPDATDVYGRTKALGESRGAAALSIRCSLIGADRANGRGLVEWFLGTAEGSSLTGFKDQRWNGVTTLQLADAFAELIARDAFAALRELSHVHHFCPNPAITKYDLLAALDAASGGKRTVGAGTSGAGSAGRVLASRYGALNALVPDRVPWDRLVAELLRSR
ncbi:MAG TPA: sugar nucleotide-binding protein [Candidatus Elarobacter sp.]